MRLSAIVLLASLLALCGLARPEEPATRPTVEKSLAFVLRDLPANLAKSKHWTREEIEQAREWLGEQFAGARVRIHSDEATYKGGERHKATFRQSITRGPVEWAIVADCELDAKSGDAFARARNRNRFDVVGTVDGEPSARVDRVGDGKLLARVEVRLVEVRVR